MSMKEYYTRVNKIPYLLWFSDGIILDADLQKKIVQNGNAISNIKKVSKTEIFLMKYLPLLLLLLVGGNAPDSMLELAYFGVGALLTYLVMYMFLNHINWFKLLVFFISAFVWFLLLKVDGSAYVIDRVLLYSFESLMIGYVLWEILSKRWDKYYYLINVKSDVKISSERKKRPLIKIGNKEFLKFNTGVNYLKTMRMSGYYLCVIEEINNDENKCEQDVQ